MKKIGNLNILYSETHNATPVVIAVQTVFHDSVLQLHYNTTCLCLMRYLKYSVLCGSVSLTFVLLKADVPLHQHHLSLPNVPI